MKLVATLMLAFLALTGCQSAGAKADSQKPVASAQDNDPRPFDESRDAMADVDAALAAAKQRRTRVLLVLGANWCHDSRGLAAKFEDPSLADLIARRYELVYVDVGHRDRNLDVAARFGVHELIGTPTILILSPEGDLLNAGSVNDWRNAASRPLDETRRYFESFAD